MLTSLLLTASLAVAQTPLDSNATADAVTDYKRSLDELDLETDLIRPVQEPFVLSDGPYELAIHDGYMVPVFAGRFAGEWERRSKQLIREQRMGDEGAEARLPDASERGNRTFVGFVWLRGEADLSVSFTDRADGMGFADRMVRHLGEPADDYTEIAHGRAPFVTTADEALVLSVNHDVRDWFLGPDDDADLYEVTVWGIPGIEAIRDRAGEIFRQRLRVYERFDHELGDHVAWDLASRHNALEGDAEQFALIDAHTAHRYGGVVRSKAPSAQAAPRDRWLSLLRDNRGELDPRRRSWVLTAGIGDGDRRPMMERFGGELFDVFDPADPFSPPVPPIRAEPVLAHSRLFVQENRGGTLEISIENELTVKAIGGDMSVLKLVFPMVEAKARAWELVSATLNGASLTGEHALIDTDELSSIEEDDDDNEETKSWRGDEQRTSTVTLVFPEPVPEGEEVTFTVKWTDVWPFMDLSPCAGTLAGGMASGLQRILPTPANALAGNAWQTITDVALLQEATLTAAASGVTTQTWSDGAWKWTRSEHTGVTAMWSEVAIGQWGLLDEPAYPGLPAVNARPFTGKMPIAKTFPPEVRRIVTFYDRFLPVFPAGEIDVFESPARCGGLTWVAPSGMVQLQQMVWADAGMTSTNRGQSPRESAPHLEHALLAHELAHQYWGHYARPANLDDFWIAESMSEMYACMYVRAAFKPKDCEIRMKANRLFWESVEPGAAMGTERTFIQASLTDAYQSVLQPQIVYDYGSYVLFEMLRPRVGEARFFVALNDLLEAHPYERVTTEHLKAALEQSAGRDLTDFFDYWIHVGAIPAVTLEWGVDDAGNMGGTITSDVPFGTFDVPVHIIDKGGEEYTIWVDVIDGKGTLGGLPVTKPKVTLDPEHRILARKRTVIRSRRAATSRLGSHPVRAHRTPVRSVRWR